MQHRIAVAIVMGFWSSLYLLDAFLKTLVHFVHRSLSDGLESVLPTTYTVFSDCCETVIGWVTHRLSQRPYTSLLACTGLHVSIAQLRWYTTSFNRLFLRIGQWRPRLLRLWFTAGVYFGFVAMFASLFLLLMLVVNSFKKKPSEQQVLTPVMPGVNLPMNQVGYYLLTLLVCGVLHEVGHAISAVREQVRVNGFGVFILILYPGAFVDLYTEHLQVIAPLRQLRIYCAGIWHNFVIVIGALVTLLLLPWLLLPFYHTGSAVAITSVVENSAVSGPRGLGVGDQVTSMGDCQVTSIASWVSCINHSMMEKSPGFCMSLDQIKLEDVSPRAYTTAMGNVECCLNATNTHLCFAYNTKGSAMLQHACLPARTTVERPQCRLQSDCYSPGRLAACVTPSLDNSTKLLRVVHPGKAPLLFLGHPLDLHYAVTLSDYIPRYSVLSVHLPYVFETFCKYLISLSGALAILNVVPCYALDGQWILLAFIELFLRSIIHNQEYRNAIYTVILIFGTSLLAANVVIAMWTLVR